MINFAPSGTTLQAFPQHFVTSPLAPSPYSQGPLMGPPSAGGLSPLSPAVPAPLPADGTLFSAEAMGGEATPGNGFSSLLGGLMQNYGAPAQPSVDQLTQQLEALQQQMAQAQQSGDSATLAALAPALQALMAQLMQAQGGAANDAPSAPSSASGMAPAAGGGGGSGGGGPVSGGSTGGGGGGSVSGGGGGGGGDSVGSTGSSSPSSSGAGSSSGASEISKVPPQLAGDDKKLARFIEGQLKGTPLGGHGMGAHFVAAGREKDVDPLALLAISRHETRHGELGVGVEKHMGVGAFDSSPNAPRQWDGALNQIYSGAETFKNLRAKGGSDSDAPLAQQLSAVNKAGWATDQSWHGKVGSHYNEIAGEAREAAAASKPEPKPAPRPTPTETAPEKSKVKPSTTSTTLAA